MSKLKVGVILAFVGGILAFVGPFLTASTVTMTVGSLVRTEVRSWIGMSPIFYLAVGSGALAVLVGVAALIRPRAIWSVLVAVSAIVIAFLLVMAQAKMAGVIGSRMIITGIALGAMWGEAPSSLEIVSGIGAYFLIGSVVILTLAAPLVALKK